MIKTILHQNLPTNIVPNACIHDTYTKRMNRLRFLTVFYVPKTAEASRRTDRRTYKLVSYLCLFFYDMRAWTLKISGLRYQIYCVIVWNICLIHIFARYTKLVKHMFRYEWKTKWSQWAYGSYSNKHTTTLYHVAIHCTMYIPTSMSILSNTKYY